MRPRKIAYEPPSEEELERARDLRLREIRMFDVIREIIFYVIFFLLLLIVTYNFRDPNAFHIRMEMERLFAAPSHVNSFSSVRILPTFYKVACRRKK